ncbi:Leucine-binding domain-containing protein [Desulfonema magnum]|uniref:Leucine-binding domain-containing protein n=2 Tax=Desulfonema magnum TaxID=45655 RepID=A0A975BXU8_9BACT|nr:Leucine-binding domain-containing protein [Desulfonema magnum]
MKFFRNFLLTTVILSLMIWTGCEYFKGKSEGIHIAVVVPQNTVAGKSHIQGVKQYVDEVNKKGGINGKKIIVDVFDDQNSRKAAKEKATEVAKKERIVAVIGHSSSSNSLSAGGVYKKYEIPAVAPSSTSDKVTLDNDWYFRTVFNNSFQGRFLAYYVKKILGRNSVCIIREDPEHSSGIAEVFADVAKELGLEVRYTKEFKVKAPDLDKNLEQIVNELNNEKNDSAIFLGTHAPEGIKLLKLIKDAGIKNPVIGPTAFGSQAFQRGFEAFPKEKEKPGYYTNGLYIAVPLIFDTANELAQDFKNAYQKKYKEKPDWMAAYSYDTAMVIVNAIEKNGITGEPGTIQSDRKKIRDYLANLTEIDDALEGTTGLNYFDKNGDCPKPLTIGVYRNKNIISALAQLQPVRHMSLIPDLEESLRQENILVFDDQYMYKTKVVYSGVEINSVSELDVESLSCLIDFHIWFRYQGDFDAQNVKFLNAIDPIQLKTPVRKAVPAVVAKTVVPAIRKERAAGSDMAAEISDADAAAETSDADATAETSDADAAAETPDADAAAETPDADVVTETKTDTDDKHQAKKCTTAMLVKEEKMGGLTSRLYHVKAHFRTGFTGGRQQAIEEYHGMGFRFRHDELSRNNLIYVTDILGMGLSGGTSFKDKMKKDSVLSPEYGWVIDNARFFQNTAEKSSMGDLRYLDIQNKFVECSQFNFDVMLKKDTFSLRRKISDKTASYLAVISFILLIFLVIASFNKSFNQRSKSVWFLQVVSAFFLLLSAEVVLLKILADTEARYLKLVILIFDVLWWLIPAFFLHMALRPFVWKPMEKQTGRPVPNVLRRFPAYIIYFITGYGIIAFVFNQNITNLMATSGAVAMAVGLLVKDNISNFFASISIIQGYEIRMGQWVKIDGFDEGKVEEITKLVTRIRTRDNGLLSIPNSVVLGSTIQNYGDPDDIYRIDFTLETVPEASPDEVTKVIETALRSTEGILKNPEPFIIFKGQGDSSAIYTVVFAVKDYTNRAGYLTAAWKSVWRHFEDANIELATPHRFHHLIEEPPSELVQKDMA